MDGHSICAEYVRCDESGTRADSLHTTVWTTRSPELLCVDPTCKEPSADADQCGGNSPMRSRVIQAFWLTQQPNDRIINTYTNKERE